MKELTALEKKELLVKQSKQISEEIQRYPRGSKERNMLGQSLLRVNSEINKIRTRARHNPGSEHFFITAAMDLLPKATVIMIWDRAVALKEKYGMPKEIIEQQHPYKEDK